MYQKNNALHHSIYNRFFIAAPIYTEETSAYNTSNETQLIEILAVTDKLKSLTKAYADQQKNLSDEPLAMQTDESETQNLCMPVARVEFT